MPPLKSLDVFSSFSTAKTNFIQLWEESDYIELIASADVRGVIGLANLELACLSHGKKYKRTFRPSSRHLPKDASFEWPNHDGLSIRIVTGESSFQGISIEHQNVSIESSNVEVVFEESEGIHQGVLDSLGIVTFLVNEMLPQEPKIKRMRPLMLAGQWLRKSMESNYDPIYMKLRDALHDDGLIRLLPMVEVEEEMELFLPSISQKRFNKLVKMWPKMDYGQRRTSLSELALPALRDVEFSTGRLEELIWKRVIFPGSRFDLATLLWRIEQSWPLEDDESRLHASTQADMLVKTGELIPQS